MLYSLYLIRPSVSPAVLAGRESSSATPSGRPKERQPTSLARPSSPSIPRAPLVYPEARRATRHSPLSVTCFLPRAGHTSAKGLPRAARISAKDPRHLRNFQLSTFNFEPAPRKSENKIAPLAYPFSVSIARSPLVTRHSPLSVKSFPCRTYEKRVHNSFVCRTYKNKGLKVLYLPHLRKNPPPLPISVNQESSHSSFTCRLAGHSAKAHESRFTSHESPPTTRHAPPPVLP